MEDKFGIQLFEGKKVRFVWDEEQEKYFFSVADIVEILTDTVNPRDYIKKMLRRDAELKSKWGTIVPSRKGTITLRSSLGCLSVVSRWSRER